MIAYEVKDIRSAGASPAAGLLRRELAFTKALPELSRYSGDALKLKLARLASTRLRREQPFHAFIFAARRDFVLQDDRNSCGSRLRGFWAGSVHRRALWHRAGL